MAPDHALVVILAAPAQAHDDHDADGRNGHDTEHDSGPRSPSLRRLEGIRRSHEDIIGPAQDVIGDGEHRLGLLEGPPKPTETISLAVNGHEINARCVDGKWEFLCFSFPDIADRHKGATSSAAAVGE
ncbi:MAG: hypothetical protein ACO3CU_07720, partial [Candidatus Nanopelagicales bacterium]